MTALRPHAVPRALLGRLCDADDDLSDLDLLLRGRSSKSALSLRIIRDLAAGGAVAEPQLSAFLAQIAVMTALQRSHPDAVAAVLAGPHFGAWAMHCIRRLTSPDPVGDSALPPALGHLGGFAAAAALRAGTDVAVSVTVRDGSVVIPSAGRLDVPGGPETGSAELRCAQDSIRIEVGGSTVVVPIGQMNRRTPGWRPLDAVHAVLASGRRWEVAIDPDDPYLHYFGRDSGSAANVAWGAHFGAACGIIDNLYARKTTAMARSISCLVPVAADAGIGLSATSAAAAGAVALTEPSSALGLAATLIHEHQHLKLNALHDMLPLVADAAAGYYYSPWRTDPRPASGLLHGAYAFLGVADFWFRMCRGSDARRGWYLELARVVRQVTLACNSLSDCPDLTEAGAELVVQMMHRARGWQTADLPPDIVRVADDLAVEHEVRWRLRHLTPPAAEMARLVTGRIGSFDEPDTVAPEPEDKSPGYGTDSGLALSAKRWAAGEQPAELVDRLILGGRYAAAQSVLVGRLREEVTSAGWAALVVVARHTDLARRCPPLRTHPELAFALYQALRQRRTRVCFVDLARHLAVGGPH